MFRIDVEIDGIRKTLPKRWKLFPTALRNYRLAYMINPNSILVCEKPYFEFSFKK